MYNYIEKYIGYSNKNNNILIKVISDNFHSIFFDQLDYDQLLIIDFFLLNEPLLILILRGNKLRRKELRKKGNMNFFNFFFIWLL